MKKEKEKKEVDSILRRPSIFIPIPHGAQDVWILN